MAEIVSETKNVVRHPLEYFDRMRVKETLDHVRTNQLRDEAPDDDEGGD